MAVTDPGGQLPDGQPPGDGDLRAASQAACELAAAVFGDVQVAVDLLDGERVAGSGPGPLALPGGADLFLADASADPRIADPPDGPAGMYCAVLLRNPDGHPLGTLGVAADQPREITPQQARALRTIADQLTSGLELRLRTEQLAAAADELTRSQDRLAAFAGKVSHDLKTPITAILGFTELLLDLDTVTDDPSINAYVGRCSSAAGRMLEMVDEMLAYARVGGAELAPRDVALDDVLPGLRDDLGRLLAGATLSWDGPDVRADPAQLRGLLKHLLTNALTYRGEHGSTTVRVSTERLPAATVLRVVDDGPGIPEESRAEALRPLVRLRTSTAGTTPGNGLGLAVSVRVMAAHGGSLQLTDTPGGGTTVVCTFPG